MKTKSQSKAKHRKSHQRGAALIILMLAIVLSLVTLVTFRSERKGPEQEAQRKTALALAQAKEALLGNTAINSLLAPSGAENPGRLPCPNVYTNPTAEGNSVGLSGPNCQSPGPGIPQNMGRFPWKSLKVGDLRDGAAERLWYVIDRAFVDTGVSMNSTITPTLSVNGAGTVAAVIISPGPALGARNQQRDTANQDNYMQYLESYTSEFAIVNSAASTSYNDRIITVTAQEVFTFATQRVVGELAKTSLTVPYPATLDMVLSKPLVWDFNNWDDAVTVYSVSTTSVPKDTLKLQFANCASVFTVRWDGTRNNVTRSGPC